MTPSQVAKLMELVTEMKGDLAELRAHYEDGKAHAQEEASGNRREHQDIIARLEKQNARMQPFIDEYQHWMWAGKRFRWIQRGLIISLAGLFVWVSDLVERIRGFIDR